MYACTTRGIIIALVLAVTPVVPLQPCSFSKCGPYSRCWNFKGQDSCSCVPGYVGKPPNCRPECVVNSDCGKNEACSNQKCRNPCPGTCGVGAICEVVNHNPICCPTKFTDLGEVQLSVRYVTSDSATVALVEPEERAVCLHLFNVTVSWAADGHVSNTTEPQPADQPVTLHRLLAACTNYSVQARILTASRTTVLNSTFKTVCKRDDQEPDTSNTRPTPTGGCVLPSQSLNRQFCSFKQGCEHCTGKQCVFEPGDTILHVKVKCELTFGLSDGRDIVPMVCENGSWHQSFPTCIKVCPHLQSDSLIINCMNAVNKVDCDKPMVPGTTAEYRCRPSHSQYPGVAQHGFYNRTLRCEHSGEWSGLLYPCQPDCGVSEGNFINDNRIALGMETKLGEFPWHAGLYRLEVSTQSWEHICGGTLITKSVVLTAAHCVFRDYQKELHPSELRVALAKYNRSWTHQEEKQVKCKVSHISLNPYFRGPRGSYAVDSALLVLTEPVAINSFVMPVCIDYSMTLHLKNNTLGYVVGWGKTSEGGVERETLLHSEVAIPDSSRCIGLVQSTSSFSYDKFCAIKESVTESVVEQGDSGGGLTTIGVGGLHFIVGITSTRNGNVPLFTNISWVAHREWLDRQLRDKGTYLNSAKYSSPSNDADLSQSPTDRCYLPSQSLNRQFCSFKIGCEHCTGKECAYKLGDRVGPQVKVLCGPGFGLSDGSDHAVMDCLDDGTWHSSFPRCVKLCPPLKSDSVILNCMTGVKKVDCDKPMAPGTTVDYHCRPNHYPGPVQHSVHDRIDRCNQRGEWSGPLYSCEPECGQSKGESSTIPSTVNWDDTNLSVFPWHAGIYNNIINPLVWRYICGGTLITKLVVLTAAHCVEDERQGLSHDKPDNFRVALGKYYRSWNHTEQYEVKRSVNHIFLQPDYRGPIDGYAFDIALMVLDDYVAVNSFIMPVCTNFSSSWDVASNKIGYFVGKSESWLDIEESRSTLRQANILVGSSCRNLMSRNTFLVEEMICAIESAKASVVQSGDSGGGLTMIGDRGLHYIVGIISSKYNDSVTLLTNLEWAYHQEWIKNKLFYLLVIFK